MAPSIFSRDPLADPEALIRRVYGYVAKRIGPGANAEDVTSEVFERAVRYRGTYDPSKGKPILWLIGIARRCLDNHARWAAAEGHHLDIDEVMPAAPGDVEDATGRRLELDAAVERLDERDRELISLRYGADLTARSIAELLELHTNAVEVALHRALRRLRADLEQGRLDVPHGALAPR